MKNGNGHRPRRPRLADKSPAYQWYPRDAISDGTMMAMSNEEEGIYRRLLDHAWLEDGLPNDRQALMAWSRVPQPDHFDMIWMRLSPLFPEGPDGRLRNQRQEREREKQRKNSRKKKLAARVRWSREQSIRNAHAYAPALQVQCLAFALALASTEDQKQEEQRVAVRRALPARMVPPAERRRHLLAAVHKLLDQGPPYVTAEGPNIAEISAELKGIARQLNVDWSHTRQLDGVINAALARRPKPPRPVGSRRVG